MPQPSNQPALTACYATEPLHFGIDWTMPAQPTTPRRRGPHGRVFAERGTASGQRVFCSAADAHVVALTGGFATEVFA